MSIEPTPMPPSQEVQTADPSGTSKPPFEKEAGAGAQRYKRDAYDWTTLSVYVLTLLAAGLAAFYSWESNLLTQESNRISFDSFVLSQRPFVAHHGVRIKLDEDGAVRLSLGWTNTGNMPTRNLTVNAGCHTHTKSMLEDTAKIVSEMPKGGSRNVLGPKLESDIGNCFVPASLINDIRTGKLFLIVRGRADYRDGIAGSRPRETQFCSQISVEGGGDKPISIGGSMCDDYNCADEECDEQRSRLAGGAQDVSRTVEAR